MNRGLTILAALAATLAVALPAAAENGVMLKGTIASVSDTSVTFKNAKGATTTCLVGEKSPSLDGYAAGDPVQAACLRVLAKLVLAKIRHVAKAGGGDGEPVSFGGVVTALSDTSISLHDGNRDLTCTITADSPSTAGVNVGVHVRVACANGVLVKLALVATGDGKPAPPTGDGKPAPPTGDGKPAPPTGDSKPAPTNTVTAAGVLTALSETSLTVHNAEHGDVSCTLGPSSPRLGDFHLGDRVGVACTDGVLVKIAKLTSR